MSLTFISLVNHFQKSSYYYIISNLTIFIILSPFPGACRRRMIWSPSRGSSEKSSFAAEARAASARGGGAAEAPQPLGERLLTVLLHVAGAGGVG